jgi:hypothetical protein
MGGIKSIKLNEIAKDIWSCCINRNIWISADYVPGKFNVADAESKNVNDNTEWMLEVTVFNRLTKLLGSTDLDLFATRLNTQLSRFSSWKPDPEAEFVSAFSKSWSDLFYFIFPPFSLVSRCLQKIQRDRAEVLMIVPLWPTQLWYPMLMEMLIDYPVLLTHRTNLLRIPGMEKIHPLHSQLNLIACQLSGKIWKTKEFQIKLPKSYWLLGEAVRKKQYATYRYIKRWLNFCSQRQINSLKPSLSSILDFLTDLFESGLTYSSINCD